MNTESDIRWIVRSELRGPELRELVRYELERERFRRTMTLMEVAIWVLVLAIWAVALWQAL